MKNRRLGLAVMSLLLASFFFALAPAWSQNIDDRINALEQELSQLKEQQIELKKEATAATAALPTFSYRPGGGLNIEAADKAWSINFGLESHVRMYFMEGQDQYGRTKGELEMRRFRPQFEYCINNCLWQILAYFDLDGFGGNSLFQRAAVEFHGENLNPWLPTVHFGGDVSTTIGTIRQGSSATGTQMDYDLLVRNNGFNTGSAGWGVVLNWDDKPIGGMGRITRFQLAYAIAGKGSDNVQINTDHKDGSIFLGIEPFSQIKNKWISGLRFEMGSWWCHVDDRAQAGNVCNRLRLRENENAGQATLYDTGTLVGRGTQHFLHPGLQWTVGPYRLRAIGGWMNFDGGNNAVISQALKGDPRARNWLVAHDIFLWSPKGWFTGSPTTTGSVLFGTHFERNNVDCRNCPTINGGQFHRSRVLVREWDLWYFVAPAMSIGAHFIWYDASNLQTGATAVQDQIFNKGNARPGKGGDWVNVILNWRYQF